MSRTLFRPSYIPDTVETTQELLDAACFAEFMAAFAASVQVRRMCLVLVTARVVGDNGVCALTMRLAEDHPSALAEHLKIMPPDARHGNGCAT